MLRNIKRGAIDGSSDTQKCFWIQFAIPPLTITCQLLEQTLGQNKLFQPEGTYSNHPVQLLNPFRADTS